MPTAKAIDTPASARWTALKPTDRSSSPMLAVDRTKAPGDELRDPFGVLPAVWFQRSGNEESRQRWHLDVWVDPAEVRPRIEAAITAGGTLVYDEEAPSFWVLADPDGNKVCLCTWQERDGDDP